MRKTTARVSAARHVWIREYIRQTTKGSLHVFRATTLWAGRVSVMLVRASGEEHVLRKPEMTVMEASTMMTLQMTPTKGSATCSSRDVKTPGRVFEGAILSSVQVFSSGVGDSCPSLGGSVV